MSKTQKIALRHNLTLQHKQRKVNNADIEQLISSAIPPQASTSSSINNISHKGFKIFAKSPEATTSTSGTSANSVESRLSLACSTESQQKNAAPTIAISVTATNTAVRA